MLNVECSLHCHEATAWGATVERKETLLLRQDLWRAVLVGGALQCGALQCSGGAGVSGCSSGRRRCLEMDQEALLARAVPRRCVRPPPNKSAVEFRSVAKPQCGVEHLARVRERQRDFSLVMQQLEESTETTLAIAAPVHQHEQKPAATARGPAHTSPAAAAAAVGSANE